MTANFAQRFRTVAWLLLAAIAAAGIGLFFGASNSATAASYVYSGSGGTVANTNEVEIHYVWSTGSDRVTIGLYKPSGLEAVWTNLDTSDSIVQSVSDNLNNLVTIQAPVNSWSANAKVSLKVRDRGSTSSPNLGGIQNNGNSTNNRMFEVISLGNFPGFSSLQYAFARSSGQLRISAQLPSTVNDLSYAFSDSTFNGDLSGWNTGNVVSFQQTFYSATTFNQPLANWNVASATNMANMFSNAYKFNQNISNWDVSKVTTMTYMFASAWDFNNGDQTVSASVGGQYPLSWNTPSLSNIAYIFFNANVFNQNLDTWTLNKVTNMQGAFWNAARFNNGDAKEAYEGDSSNSNVAMTWSFSAPADMTQTFQGATNFNQDLNTWDVSRVTKMVSTFQSATNFNNGDLSRALIVSSSHNVVMSWSPSSVTSFRYMFSLASRFNQDLSSWDVSRATTFEFMFDSASSFNNGESKSAYTGDTYSNVATMPWNPAAATNLGWMFSGASSFNQDISNWNVSSVATMQGMFLSAVDFNNGKARGVPGVLNWTISQAPNSELLTDTFNGASAFNQDLNSLNISNVTKLLRTFAGATSFNNGDPIGSYEGDGRGNDLRMLWNTSNVTNLQRTFERASNFNQNLSSWTVSKVTDMTYLFGSNIPDAGVFNNGASSLSSNVMAWSTSALTTAYGLFSGLPYFNADITSWNTSKVSSMVSAFSNAKRFNQNISGWNVGKVTSLQFTFQGAESFSQDLTSWGEYRAVTNLSYAFSGAKNIPDFLKNWDVTSVSNFVDVFGSTSTPSSSLPAEAVLRAVIGSWSLQKVATSRAIGYFRAPLYTNCKEWSAYWRLKYSNGWTFNGADNYLPATPTCNNVTVTWSPTSTIAYSNGTVSPDVLATTDGPSGVRYAMYHSGNTGCRVNPDSGVISYVSSGSCQIIAYDADTASDTATAGRGFKVVTFTLPTPGSQSTPDAPFSVSARAAISALSVTFSAPVSNGGLPLIGYEVGYSLTQGGATTWVSVSPVVTSSSTLSFTLSGLVNGTSYWVKARAINSLGAGAASSEFGPVAPATTPSAPSIASSTISAGTVTLTLGAPGTNGGAAITSYEYRLATSSTAVLTASWTSSGTTSTTISVSGLVNGTSYFFQVRAVNSVGAGSATAVSSGITPITTTSPVVIYVSNKLGYSPLAEIQFFAPADNGGSAILDYQIRMSTNEGATWTNWANQAVTYNVNTQRWYITLTNLDGTNLAPVYYTFEIRARNAAGFSATSLQVPSGAPITSVNFGNQQAVINFKAAKFDGNSPILGYEYKYVSGTIANPSTVSPWISISSTVWQNATTTSAVALTVSGLVNGTPHTLWVRAVNAIGGIDQPYWDWTLNTGTPNKQLPTISFSYSVSTVAYSESASYSPTFSSNSLGDITFSTTTPTKCSVATFSGVVTSLNAGLCTIQLSQAESPTYSATTVLRYINTTMINQPTLQISASATSSPYLGTVTLTSSGGAGVGAVTYTAVVGSACVVSGNVVTVGNAGSSCAVIATKASDGNYYSANSLQLSITTTRINQAALTFSNLAEMPARSSMSVSAIGGSGDGVLRYRVSSAGTTGCLLTGTTLTATSAGQCTIEASRASSTNYTVSASVSQVIEVVKSAQTVRFTTNVPSQPLVGSTYSPSATASSGLSISFSVSGGGCSLTSGTITFTAAGDCKVEASQAGDGAYLAAPTASQTIAVGRRNHTLALSTTSQNITAKTFGDQAFVLAANSTEAEAQVAFTLSPQTTNDACSVFSSGLVLVLNVGDCVIEAYSTQTQALAAASTITKRIEIRADKASAPFITSVAMGNLSITAGFTPPSYIGGSSVSAYTIVAIDQTPNSTIEVSDSSCGTTLVNGQISCRISGLENGKSYKIKVAAINGAGEGEFSVLSPAITVATNPAAVQNLRVIQGASTLAISWDDPDSLGGGTFSSYRVYVKRSSTTSYDADHYFNVTNQNTRNITISAETPPDGMTHPGGPALVNGVAYDIKVVTVTTANTQELTGNTAVVNQIPRTVPEPPRLANALVVANKLVLTWTAPLSDGGAAVTTYSASVGQSPCVFAAPDDTYCEIALPTAPGNYVFSIVAQNVAGSSTELQGTYTVAAYSSPAPQQPYGGSSGGTDITEPAKPSESAPVVAGVSFTADKKQIVIRGVHLKGIKKVFIGGVEAVIVSQTTEMIILRTPELKAGSHAVFLHLSDNTVLRYEKELFVEGAKPAAVVTKKLMLSGFKPGTSVLTAQMKKDLLAIFQANKSSKSLLCIGHTQGPTILKSDARLAMRRANAVCNFAKLNGIKVVTASYQNNKQVGAKFRRVDLVFTK